MNRLVRGAALCLAVLALAAAVPADGRDAEALLRALNADLLSHDSATLTLERWCATRGLAASARVTADREKGVDKPPTRAVRKLLKAAHDEPIRYRRVRLRCGGHVLSEADNWYRPSLLTDDMNRQLEGADTPFGRVVQPLGFHRRTLSAKVFRRPSPAGGVIEHRAVLELPDGRPFSALVETYTTEVLAEGR